ncbi:MAG: carboxy terminal-processing peptidase [Propionivibrio sp.]|nr:carboxy terminal-processing peptidase [Propionivibrio sp.]
MPWEQIKAADYSPAGDLKTRIATLRARHAAQVKNDFDFPPTAGNRRAKTSERTTTGLAQRSRATSRAGSRPEITGEGGRRRPAGRRTNTDQ